MSNYLEMHWLFHYIASLSVTDLPMLTQRRLLLTKGVFEFIGLALVTAPHLSFVRECKGGTLDIILDFVNRFASRFDNKLACASHTAMFCL